VPDSLDRIDLEVRNCQLCRLCETRTNGVPGEGAARADIMFIGEGPGFHEDQQGRPFVGAAGNLLVDMLRLIGLRREDVFITNVVRCRPPGNRDPLPDELAACDDYSLRQIKLLEPKVLVTLGRFSMARFFGTGPMRDLHGKVRDWNGISCLALYHPAFILRTPTPELRRVYEEDFRKIPLLLAEAQQKLALAAAVVEAEATVPLDQLPLF
jgi:DNA polymerase